MAEGGRAEGRVLEDLLPSTFDGWSGGEGSPSSSRALPRLDVHVHDPGHSASGLSGEEPSSPRQFRYSLQWNKRVLGDQEDASITVVKPTVPGGRSEIGGHFHLQIELFPRTTTPSR